MADIKIKQGEGKTLTFTYTDSNGAAVSLAGSTLTFRVQASGATSHIILMDSGTTAADWTRTNETSGIVTVDLSTSYTSQAAGTYNAEIKAVWSSTNTDKSRDLSFVIDEAINR